MACLPWPGRASRPTSTARPCVRLGRHRARLDLDAKQDPTLGAALEVQDRIRVRFQGQTQDSRIVGIKHDIRGDRWLMTLELVA
jgi:hypothetical protein